MSETIGEPFVLAALARGVPRSRIVWRGALKAALRPVAAVYGLIIGSLLSGSFAVEVITAWPGLGSLMLQALRTRDVYLVAGCAGAGALFLAGGTLVSDLALAAVDPRASETRAEHGMTRGLGLALVGDRAAGGDRRAGGRAARGGRAFRRPAQRAADRGARRRRGSAPGTRRSSTAGGWSTSSSSATRRIDRRACRWRGSPAGAWCGSSDEARRRCCCSAPTATAATSSPACSSAPAPRWASPRPPRSARCSSARRSAASPASPAA